MSKFVEQADTVCGCIIVAPQAWVRVSPVVLRILNREEEMDVTQTERVTGGSLDETAVPASHEYAARGGSPPRVRGYDMGACSRRRQAPVCLPTARRRERLLQHIHAISTTGQAIKHYL